MFPIPLILLLLPYPRQGASTQHSLPGRCLSRETSHPIITHAVGHDFSAHSQVHRESNTVLTAHRQCQHKPTSSAAVGWICPLAPQWGEVATGRTALPPGISKQDQLLAVVGRTTSQALSRGLMRPHPLSLRCIPLFSGCGAQHSDRTPPLLESQQCSRPEVGNSIWVGWLLSTDHMPGSSCRPS